MPTNGSTGSQSYSSMSRPAMGNSISVIPPPIKMGLSYKREKDNEDDELDKIMDDILKNDNSK